METREIRRALGTRAFWGRVGYAGEAHAAAPGTYQGVGGRLALTTVEDAGVRIEVGSGIANLLPLVAAALYEGGFASEAGPLSTWSS